MNTHTKGLPNGGTDSSKPNPWADKKPVNRNVSSGVLKLGARFENLNDSEKTPVSKSPLKPVVSKLPPNFIQPAIATGSNNPTPISKDSERPTFPKPSQLKPIGVPKPALNLPKPSLNTGSSTSTTTNSSSVERPVAPSGPIPPVSGLKPKPLVPTRQSTHQDDVQENSTQKDGVKKTLSSSKAPAFLCQQQATPSVNKSVDFSAEDRKPLLSKLPSSPMPPKPPNIKPVFKQKPDTTDGSISKEKTTEDGMPKLKPLPNVFALGKCPKKPKRPPHVDLSRFTSASASTNDLSSPSDEYVVPCESELSAVVQEESYDDVGVMKPPPSHPGGIVQHPQEQGVDEELYEDLEERWADNEQTDTKKAPKGDQRKCDKEEKKRLEQEKKEQKAREKKERESRKKFKLSGAVVVLQDATALVDCKGGKNELALTQGETIEIIRMTDNPEGLWLARNSEGLYGYVKTAALKVDHNALKAHSGQLPDGAGEVYDDVGAPDGASMKDISFPPVPPPGALPGNDDELYDDVCSQSFPPPPPLLHDHPAGKTEEIDGKKKKKFEKEEKEFRKKFKYDGEISVLYKVVVDPALTSKKWGGKDLPLKPGESIDVIVKPQDGKFIGRNKDGKFGYVCLDHIQQDAEIYDDIGEDCIYDN